MAAGMEEKCQAVKARKRRAKTSVGEDKGKDGRKDTPEEKPTHNIQ